MLETLKADFAKLADTKVGWFFLGVFLAQNDMATVIASVKATLGL